MFYIFLPVSILSFFALTLGDLWDALHRRTLSILFSILGYLGVISSIIFLIWTQNTLNPGGGRFPLLRWSAAGLFALLLVYSTFFAVPGGRSGGNKKKPRKVSDKGMYGIVRHPGFYWFTLLLGAMITIYYNLRFIAGGMLLILLNFILIFLEDRLLFPKIFSDYGEYKKNVPFIFPKVTKDNAE